VSHPSRADPAGAPAMLAAAGLPSDEFSKSLMEEAAFLAASAPAPRAAVPNSKPPPTVPLPAPRTKRVSTLCALFAVLAAVITLAASPAAGATVATAATAATAAGAAYLPASLTWKGAPPPVAECSFRLFNCVQLNEVPGGRCGVSFSPLPKCVAK